MTVRRRHQSRLDRFRASVRLALSLAALLLLAGPLPAQCAAAPIERVAAAALVVSDAGRAADFYTNVLSFEKVSDREVFGEPWERLYGVFGARVRIVRLRLGDEFLELQEFLASPGRPMPVASRGNDRWFQHVAIIVSDMDRAYGTLRSHNVRHASTAPQTLPDYIPGAAGIRAFYFRDPDGHFLELLQFPPDKGDAKWHRPSGKLFLGIDHTAVVVADTDASLRFYRDTLGLRVAGESENYGPEQEHLNNVFGARLRITALRAAAGPGVELLEYLAPRDGLPMPPDSRASDLWAWKTILVARDPAAAWAAVRGGAYPLVSASVVELPAPDADFARGFLARDPDGHIVQIAGE